MNARLKKITKLLGKISLKLFKLFLLFLLITTVVATIIIQTSGDGDFQFNPNNALLVNDVTQLNPIHVSKVIKPENSAEIISGIMDSTGPISIGGGRYSMGGQTAYEDSLHFDMRTFNKVLNLDKDNKTVTVQAGITWRDLQEFIDPHDLSIRIMQTYANFTVGGSLSVNVHGRYIGEGPLIKSVQSIKIILASGEEKEASPDVNSELFYGAIGGYGGIGVITEATLNLTDNLKIERRANLLETTEYLQYFKDNIRENNDVVFHNGDLYPPDYEEIRDVSWYKSSKEVTVEEKLIPKDDTYYWGPRVIDFISDYDIGKSIRRNIVDPIIYSSDLVVWRNWEASYDVAELEPQSRKEETYVLREYFVPVDDFEPFVADMKEIFNSNDVNIINVSIRHAKAAPENYLSWANEEVFAFVVYYLQGTDEKSIEGVKKWSKEMIDAVISYEGTYYLPYQVFASSDQFLAAYPNAPKFFDLKKRVDPEYRFRNQLWKNHYPSAESTLEQQKADIDGYYKNENQSILSVPEWYLVFNPLEYAEFLEAGHNPSDFPFMASIKEYWSLYDRVVNIGQNYGPENSDYMIMLKVIGISTTVEFMYKSLYENTIGSFTRWTANNEDTEEDKIIIRAQRGYSDLIFNEAWYKYNFGEWVNKIWKDTDFFGPNFIRKTERKLFFTAEFGFKSLYAKLIGFGAQTAYEPSDGKVYLTAIIPEGVLSELPDTVRVLHEGEEGLTILSLPRWGGFTETVPVLVAMGIQFKDISGNANITVSIIKDVESNADYKMAIPLFESEFVSDANFTRNVYLVNVTLIDEFLIEVKNRNHKIEHIYDF